ncbi:MAG: hypothetical protein AVDCRST_MAG89-222, partial [uncultured Gemmatimonadetes bacterium]
PDASSFPAVGRPTSPAGSPWCGFAPPTDGRRSTTTRA